MGCPSYKSLYHLIVESLIGIISQSLLMELSDGGGGIKIDEAKVCKKRTKKGPKGKENKAEARVPIWLRPPPPPIKRDKLCLDDNSSSSKNNKEHEESSSVDSESSAALEIWPSPPARWEPSSSDLERLKLTPEREVMLRRQVVQISLKKTVL